MVLYSLDPTPGMPLGKPARRIGLFVCVQVIAVFASARLNGRGASRKPRDVSHVIFSGIRG